MVWNGVGVERASNPHSQCPRLMPSYASDASNRALIRTLVSAAQRSLLGCAALSVRDVMCPSVWSMSGPLSEGAWRARARQDTELSDRQPASERSQTRLGGSFRSPDQTACAGSRSFRPRSSRSSTERSFFDVGSRLLVKPQKYRLWLRRLWWFHFSPRPHNSLAALVSCVVHKKGGGFSAFVS